MVRRRRSYLFCFLGNFLAVVAVIGLLIARISWTLFLVIPYNEFVGQGAWARSTLPQLSLWGPRVALISGPIGTVWYVIAQFFAGNSINPFGKQGLSSKAAVGILMCGWPALPLCAVVLALLLAFFLVGVIAFYLIGYAVKPLIVRRKKLE